MNGALLVVWLGLSCPALTAKLPLPAKLAVCTPVLEIRGAASLEATHAVSRGISAPALISVWRRGKAGFQFVEMAVK